jgi:CRP/FNR family cyclic AMP-dependent transcriptional regulator
VRRHAHRELLMARGDPAEWLACAHGAVEVATELPSGKRQVLAFLPPGTWFGATGVLGGGCATHDAQAQGDTTVLCVPGERLASLALQHAELPLALLRLQAQRQRALMARLEGARWTPIDVRLARALLQLARDFGEEEPGPEPAPALRIALQLQQEQLAQLVGCTRQRVNVALQALQRQGLVRVKGAAVVVLRSAQLRSVLAGPGN